MICLVTGGAGFIGTNIVEELVRRGEKVRVLDNFATGRKENIAHLLAKIEFIEGDIRDLKMVRKAVEGIDYVLHQAALPSVPRSIKDPLSTNETNIKGTLNVLVASREAKVKRVVYASSSSVYGDISILVKEEKMKLAPLSPYAVSKLGGEAYCQVFYTVYGLETVVLRYFNVFGPHQDPISQYAAVIPKFIKAMLKGKSPIVYGDGEQSRDFTFVDNIVQANLLALEEKEVAGKVFNIACGERITINELVQALNKILKVNIAPVYTEPRLGEVKHSLANISQAKNKLKYKPKVTFEEGLKKTVEWYKNGEKLG